MTLTSLRLTEKITLLVLGIALFVGVAIASVGDWTLRQVGTDLKQARLNHINTAQINATDSITPVVRADGAVVGMLVVRGGASDEATVIKASAGTPLPGKDVMFISAAQLSAADEIVAPIDQMRSTLLGATAVIMVLAAMFGLVVARSVTDPLGRLTADVKRLAKGDTNLKFADTSRKDEIGEISRALETVRDSIVEMGRSKNATQTQMFAGLGFDSALNSALDNLSRVFFDFGRGLLRALEFITGEFMSAGRDVSKEVSKTDVFKNVKGIILPLKA
jgi:methyl-accepting chemotaxis protein